MARKYATVSHFTTVEVMVGQVPFGGRKVHRMLSVYAGNREARRAFRTLAASLGVFLELVQDRRDLDGTEVYEVLGTQWSVDEICRRAELRGEVSRNGNAVEAIVRCRVLGGSGGGDIPPLRKRLNLPDDYYRDASEMKLPRTA